jgi:hypothetical protein
LRQKSCFALRAAKLINVEARIDLPSRTLVRIDLPSRTLVRIDREKHKETETTVAK